MCVYFFTHLLTACLSPKEYNSTSQRFSSVTITPILKS